ncbi:phospholipase A2, partial [Streptomyces cellulosae]
MHRRLAAALATPALALVGVLGTATAADAAPADKPQVLASWTQTSASSYNQWAAARANQGAWAAYGFDWSTDYCSSSPDNPFGFPFQNACARHDFGYRNYKAAGSFSANKSCRHPLHTRRPTHARQERGTQVSRRTGHRAG